MKNPIYALAAMILFSSTGFAWQINSGEFNQWSAALKPRPSVYEQIDMFFKKNAAGSEPLYSAYVQALPNLLKEKMFKDMIGSLNYYNSNASCKSFFTAQFPGRLFDNSPAVANKFESEMMRFESVSCIGIKNLNDVFETLMTDEFQKRTILGLNKIKSEPQTNRVCHNISIFAVGRSDYCFTQVIWQDEENYVIHSFNESNAQDATAFVYFREMISVVKKMKNNEILVYNLTYGRGPDLTFHSIVTNLLQNQQTKFADELAKSTK